MSIINPPKVAICIATYNGEKYLYDQVLSIISQCGINDHIFISDDGSSDTTLSIINSFGRSVTLINTNRLGGVVKNFEYLLQHCSRLDYDYIALADQDDIWLDGKLSLIKSELSHQDLIMMNGRVVDCNLNDLGLDIFKFVSFRDGLLNTFIATKYVGCCMAFRASMLKVLLPFPKKIIWHDWYLALVGLLCFNCTYSNVETILFRRHANNLSNTGKRSNATFLNHFINRVWMLRALVIALIRFIKLKLIGLNKYENFQ